MKFSDSIKIRFNFVTLLSTISTLLSSLVFAHQNEAKLQQFGFSADGKSFVMLQTIFEKGGIGGESASIQIVNVEKNSCIKNGCYNVSGHTGEDNEKADGLALKESLKKTLKLREQLGLKNPAQGTRLLELSREDSDDGFGPIQRVVFQVPATGREISVTVSQVYIPSSNRTDSQIPERSSLELYIWDGKIVRAVDNINKFRPSVLGYYLNSAYLGPDGKGVALKFGKVSRSFEGTDHENFLETFTLSN